MPPPPRRIEVYTAPADRPRRGLYCRGCGAVGTIGADYHGAWRCPECKRESTVGRRGQKS